MFQRIRARSFIEGLRDGVDTTVGAGYHAFTFGAHVCVVSGRPQHGHGNNLWLQ